MIKNLLSAFRNREVVGHAQTTTSTPTCLERLANMKRIGFAPNGIFDCGASVGYWSWEVGKLFPQATIIAIEPNPAVVPRTKDLLSQRTPKPIIEECAIGAATGIVALNVWDNDETKMSGSSIKAHVQGKPRQQIEVPLKTLNEISRQHALSPELVKLDLQGYELEALKGAGELLKTSEVFIIEFGCLEAYIDRTTPNDLMGLMYDNNYCLYDVVDLIYRPYDNALTGGDFIFVKNDSDLKQYKGYS